MNEDEIKCLIEQQKELIKTKESNTDISTNTNTAPQVINTPPTADNLVQHGINSAVMQKIQTDEKVQDKFYKTADKIIETKINKEKNYAEKDEKEAVFKNNQDACDLYGISEKTVPKWVVSAARGVQNFWYVIWLIVGFFTTAPIVFLSKKINVIFKHTWLCVLLAIIIYCGIIFTPIIINLIK